MFRYHILALLIGTILDCIIGDPHNIFHPIKVIGLWIAWLDKKLLGGNSSKIPAAKRKRYGHFLIWLVTVPCLIVMFVITILTYWISPLFGVFVEAIFTCYCLAGKSLYIESKAVVDSYKEKGIEGGRYSLSMIVGRDTKTLDLSGILKATVETIAENTSDGVIAPLFYLFIGGPILGLFYKAINTMDSMVGYHNERYEEFGCPAATLDDYMNFIPSRLTGWLTIIISFLTISDFDFRKSYYIFKRDRFNHKSPNSAQSEAAFAGALGLKLGGGAYYFGQYVEKPTIGDQDKLIEINDVERANRLLRYIVLFCQICILVITVILWRQEIYGTINSWWRYLQ